MQIIEKRIKIAFAINSRPFASAGIIDNSTPKMSGRRHHFIPQFLQSGFASRRDGDSVFTWVFRHDREPFEANICNVSVERDFYELSGKQEADDRITEAEGLFSELVNELKGANPGLISDPRIAEFLAQLELRTRHFRTGLVENGEFLMQGFADKIADEEFMIAFLKERFDSDPSILHKAICEQLAKLGRPEISLSESKQLAAPFIPMVLEHLRERLPVISQELKRTLPVVFRNAVRSAQNRILAKPSLPEIRVSAFSGLSYRIDCLSGLELIQGDSAVLFRITGKRGYKTFLEKDDVLLDVFLPLEPNRLLVGSRTHRELDYSQLRLQFARSSREHFIARSDVPENRSAQSMIGLDAAFLADSELFAIVQSGFGLTLPAEE